MNQRHFTDHTFNLALARARAADAAFLAQVAAGNGPAPSRNPREVIDEQAKARMRKALGY